MKMPVPRTSVVESGGFLRGERSRFTLTNLSSAEPLADASGCTVAVHVVSGTAPRGVEDIRMPKQMTAADFVVKKTNSEGDEYRGRAEFRS